jgi:hypothetical protein
VNSPGHAARGRPARPEVKDLRIERDIADRPTGYTQAQDSAEVKGLTLKTDTIVLRRDLQRSAAAIAARDQESLERFRARRLLCLALITMLLWMATLIVLLNRM